MSRWMLDSICNQLLLPSLFFCVKGGGVLDMYSAVTVPVIHSKYCKISRPQCGVIP